MNKRVSLRSAATAYPGTAGSRPLHRHLVVVCDDTFPAHALDWNGVQARHHFAEAGRLDPRFVEARIELAAAHSARASALVILNRPGEAEPAARRAVQLDPGSVAAHYMLGMALVMQGKITAEAAAHLAVAAGKYPRARAFLARVQAELAGPAN